MSHAPGLREKAEAEAKAPGGKGAARGNDAALGDNAERFSAALLQAIRDDNRSGASGIAIQAADYLEALATGHPDPAALEHGILALLTAQPDMAVLLHLASRALAGLATGGPAGISAAATRFRADEESARGAIARRAVSLLTGTRRVFTVSASGTVERTLAHAARTGIRFEVVVAESRPALEGRDLAARLAAAGLPVTVMVDAALPGEIRRGDLVIVGADRVGWDGFVNKVGTRALVAAAAAGRIPTYVLTPSTRFVPERVESAREATARPAEEVWEAPPPGVKVVNRTFESVPMAMVSGIVVEDMLLRPADALARALAVELDPRLTARRLAAMRLAARVGAEDG